MHMPISFECCLNITGENVGFLNSLLKFLIYFLYVWFLAVSFHSRPKLLFKQFIMENCHINLRRGLVCKLSPRKLSKNTKCVFLNDRTIMKCLCQ